MANHLFRRTLNVYTINAMKLLQQHLSMRLFLTLVRLAHQTLLQAK